MPLWSWTSTLDAAKLHPAMILFGAVTVFRRVQDAGQPQIQKEAAIVAPVLVILIGTLSYHSHTLPTDLIWPYTEAIMVQGVAYTVAYKCEQFWLSLSYGPLKTCRGTPFTHDEFLIGSRYAGYSTVTVIQSRADRPVRIAWNKGMIADSFLESEPQTTLSRFDNSISCAIAR